MQTEPDGVKAGGGVRRKLRNVALSLAVVGLTALLPWRREPRDRPDPEPWPEPLVEDEADLLVDPAAAVAQEDVEEPETGGKVDRRRARRERRRNGRGGFEAPDGDANELLPVDPAAAVVEEPDPDEPAPVEEDRDEPAVQAVNEEAAPAGVEDGEEESIDERTFDEPELAPGADLTMHAVEVPMDASADFVRDFLADVQQMVHGGVPTREQAEAAQARTQEDWLPEEWVVDRQQPTRRGGREPDGRALPVVRPPTVPRRRRSRTRRPSPRLVRYTLVVLLLGGAAALPWVVPAVPDWFAGAVPAEEPRPERTGPTIIPAPTPTGTPTTVPTPGPTPGPTESALAAAGRPLEVWVPRLKVRSPVVPISGQSGTLLPPDDAQILGWWQEGRGAGARNGSAVVTGHTVSTGGGAFDNLEKLVTGDRLRVRTSAGWITYAVERSRVYTVEELAENAASIFTLGGQSRLVLITCSDFNGEVYLSNAVVYAAPVGDEPFVLPGNSDQEVPDGGLVRPWDGSEGNTGDAPGVQLTERPF